MIKLKRIARAILFVILIVLAGLGVGLSGGVPIPSIVKRKDAEKENIELIESKEESDDEKS